MYNIIKTITLLLSVFLAYGSIVAFGQSPEQLSANLGLSYNKAAALLLGTFLLWGNFASVWLVLWFMRPKKVQRK